MGPVVGPASTLPLSRLSIEEIRRHVISEGLVAEMRLRLKARQSDKSETLALRRLVYENPYSQRKATERHDVDRLPREPQQDYGAQ